MFCMRGHLGYVYVPSCQLLQTEALEAFEIQLSQTHFVIAIAIAQASIWSEPEQGAVLLPPGPEGVCDWGLGSHYYSNVDRFGEEARAL